VEFGEYTNIPNIAAKQPHVPKYMEHWLQAYYRVSRNRPLNMGGPSGYIPICSMKSFLEIEGSYDPRTFLEVIEYVDHAQVVAAERVHKARNTKVQR
jgi:hypothetical protein